MDLIWQIILSILLTPAFIIMIVMLCALGIILSPYLTYKLINE